MPSYPHHKKHPAYGGGNSKLIRCVNLLYILVSNHLDYANIEHHSSSYEYGGGGDGGAHYDNSYGGGGYGNEGYDHYHGDGEYAHSHERGYGSGGGTDDHYYGKKEHHHHRPNSDTNVYDVVVKSKETVEDVYDQKVCCCCCAMTIDYCTFSCQLAGGGRRQLTPKQLTPNSFKQSRS